jgi:molybdenum cofactor cytidylyltransferase
MLAPFAGAEGAERGRTRPLLVHVCETWRESGVDELIVVLGKDAAALRARIEEDLLHPIRFVENPRWEAGMFSSVKAGLAATAASSTRIAISPADLPFLSKGILRRVLEAAASPEADEKTIVVPTHQGRRGHPLVIPAVLRERILSWPDTARLNQIFTEPDLHVLHLEGFDESILRDVDVPGDLGVRG